MIDEPLTELVRGPVQIDLWLWPLKARRAPDAAALSDAERARAARFRHPDLSARYILGRSRLRRILGGYLGLAADAVPLGFSDHGKPELAAPSAGALAFNLSHSGDLAALAVSASDPDRRLGVDIEAIRPLHENIDRTAFSAAEQEELAGYSAPDDRLAAFFAGWTRKEAYLKAVGSGLLAPLDRFDVALAPGDARPAIRIHDAPEATRGWRLFSFTPKEGFAGAVAVDAGTRDVMIRERRIAGV